MEKNKLFVDKFHKNKKQALLASTLILTLLLGIDTYEVEGAQTGGNGDVSETIQSPTENLEQEILEKSQASTVNLFSEADKLYEEFQEAYYVSALWDIAQEFQEKYPADSRLESIMLEAAEANLREGIRLHNRGDVDRAMIYYTRILNEEAVASIHKDVQAYVNRINSVGADALYKKFQEAYYVSARWNAAQAFKDQYPYDSRVNKVMLDAANGYRREGIIRQNRGEYDRALVYYNHILNEKLVSGLYPEVQGRVNEISFVEDSAADELFAQFQDAYYVSARWNAAQTFKNEHPNDPRVNEVMLDAANGYRREGIIRQNRGEYDRALVYYNHILNEELVTELHPEVQGRVDEISFVEDSAADELFAQFQDAYYVSARWNAAQIFKNEHPNDPRVNEVMLDAANGYRREGIIRQNRGEYDRALVYYNHILNENTVSQLHAEIQALVDEIDSIQNNPAADDLYKKFQDAYYVSELWTIAQEFQSNYPMDPRVDLVMLEAAEANFKEGIRLHNNGDLDRAMIYYNRILNEKAVASMHSDVQVYVDDINKPSAEKLYGDFQSARYVSARWNAAQELKRFYPNDSRVRAAMTLAAKENLHEGLRASRSGEKHRAGIYFERVSRESFVDTSTRHLAKIFLNQLSENRKRIVYIDPGHGGHLPGAVYRGVTEKRLNLEVSNYLINELESMGYLVMTSRTADTHIGLTERAMEANGGNADIFISVHHNAGGGAAKGIETYVQHRGGYTTNRKNFDTKDPRISESIRLADSVQSNLIRSTGFQNRGVKGNNFNVIRNTYIPAILVELGYMDNPTELAIMQTSAYQQKAAKAIANGVKTYFAGL